MFSGIVQARARVKAVEESGEIRRVRIALPRGWKVALGASVSVDGICSTVMKKGNGFFDVEYMPETLSKTTARSFEKDCELNLERSLRLGDALDAHFVAGHVDAVAKIVEIEKRGGSADILIALPAQLAKYAAVHGSITINGVGLTVAQKKDATITVSLIPYTLAHTNLGSLKKGDSVNVEVDLLARYVASLLKR